MYCSAVDGYCVPCEKNRVNFLVTTHSMCGDKEILTREEEKLSDEA